MLSFGAMLVTSGPANKLPPPPLSPPPRTHTELRGYDSCPQQRQQIQIWGKTAQIPRQLKPSPRRESKHHNLHFVILVKAVRIIKRRCLWRTDTGYLSGQLQISWQSDSGVQSIPTARPALLCKQLPGVSGCVMFSKLSSLPKFAWGWPRRCAAGHCYLDAKTAYRAHIPNFRLQSGATDWWAWGLDKLDNGSLFALVASPGDARRKGLRSQVYTKN